MMQDSFIEKLVRREQTPAIIARKALVGAAGVVVLLVLQLLIPDLVILAPFIAVGLFFLCRFLLRRLNVEYEYCMIGPELDVDILYGQRKRKSMLKLKATDIRQLMPWREFAANKPSNIAATYNACSSDRSPNRWAAQFQNSSGVCVLVFEPDERYLEAVRRFNPSAFRRQ